MMAKQYPSIPDPNIVEPVIFQQVIKENIEILQGLRGDGESAAVLHAEYSHPLKKGAILLNGWANYGNGLSDAGFYVFGDGRVQLFGAITPPSTFNSLAFSLGREYAPNLKVVLTSSDTGGNVVNVTLHPITGEVHVGTTANSVYLDGLSFVRSTGV